MRDATIEAWGGLIAICGIAILVISLYAYTDPYVTICQGVTKEYLGLFITNNGIDRSNLTGTFTVGTAGGENVNLYNKNIGYYTEITGNQEYGIRLLSVGGGMTGYCADFHITTDFPIPK